MNIIKASEYEDDQMCSICQEKFKDKDVVLLIKHCDSSGKTEKIVTSRKRRHIFHESCMTRYIDSTAEDISCPLDREKITCLVNARYYEIVALNIINFSHNYYELLDKNISCVSIIDHVNLNYKDINGKTLLYCAAQRGNLKFIRRLVRLGGSPIIPDDNGFTPLMAAISHGYKKIVRYLLSLPEVTTDINRQDAKGLSAIEYALECGHIDCVKNVLAIDGVSHDVLHNILKKEHPEVNGLIKKYLGLAQPKKIEVPINLTKGNCVVPSRKIPEHLMAFSPDIENNPELIDLLYQPTGPERSDTQVIDYTKSEIDVLNSYDKTCDDLIYIPQRK
jgi:hypothetical protein